MVVPSGRTVSFTSAQVYGNGHLNTEGHVFTWPFVFLVTAGERCRNLHGFARIFSQNLYCNC
jgi:hypothetical protein